MLVNTKSNYSSKYRLITLAIVFAVMVCGLIYRVSVLTLGEENRGKANLVLMNRSPISMQKLNMHVAQLEEMTGNIGDYSFSNIKHSIEETIDLVNQTNREIEAQYYAWLQVKDLINHDEESFVQLKEQLLQIQSLQDNEILSMKRVLDEAEKPSLITDMFNLTLTFLLGIFSSLFATIGWSLWKKKDNE